MSAMDRRGMTAGIALVGIGLYFLLVRELRFSGPAPILLLIGAILFAASASRGFGGPLVPSLVLLGLGTGFLLREPLSPWMPPWATLLLGIGAGLLVASAILRARGRDPRPAPLIPGAVLVAIAVAAGIARSFRIPVDLYDNLWRLWPWLLIVVGAILLAQAWRKRRAG